MQEWQRIKEEKQKADQEAEVNFPAIAHLHCDILLTSAAHIKICFRRHSGQQRKKQVSLFKQLQSSSFLYLLPPSFLARRASKGTQTEAVRAESEEQTGCVLHKGQDGGREDPRTEESGHRSELSVLSCGV